MEIRIEDKGIFTIAGLSITTTLDETKLNSTIPKLMNSFFGTRISKLTSVISGKGGFGMFIDPPNYNPKTDEFHT